MSKKPAASPQAGAAGWEYLVDAWQRGILFMDVMRQRGNQYQAHLAEQMPTVLEFQAELVMDGRQLPRPANYLLSRIVPGPDMPPADVGSRPFVVVDPRAGHGPGIGGFKRDSEIGAALQAGHPCYFIGFLPDPVPGQTVEDVMRAEAAFLEKVIALHPDSPGRPAVIGNCQAGWQVLMTAAMRPELFGPIIVAGAPLSYWAGWHGKNPMRYAGGLLGGSWLTALAGDLGGGRFDGAWLVQNFENLDPANTLWKKSYGLYSQIDTEAPRYLGFEKFWGGHVFLNEVEIQYIVDNLFIGNRLCDVDLVTSDGVRIDLRNIRSPIVAFCSYGDNITPPPQALGWMLDLYGDDMDVVGHDQTIVYATHDSVGHLGIFVSGATGRKEHRKFASNIELIDLLPAGIYQAQVSEKDSRMRHADWVDGEYLLSLERRTLDDVRAIVQPDVESDKRFAAVRKVSDINLGLYRSFVQPWIKALELTPEKVRGLQALHPLRVPYEVWSDRHPLAGAVAEQAEQVREHRQPVAEDNPWWALQETVSRNVADTLDLYRDWRDKAGEQWFEAVYGSPWLQAAVGQGARDEPPRHHPGVSPEHRAFVARELAQLRAEIGSGGAQAAGVRALLYILGVQGRADERLANLLPVHESSRADPQVPQPGDAEAGHQAYRTLIRKQTLLLQLYPKEALAAIPAMLATGTADEVLLAERRVAQAATSMPQDEEQARAMAFVLRLFEKAKQA